MTKYLQPLKIASVVVAGIAYLIHNELQRRETEEIVENVLAKREAESGPEQVDRSL